MGLFSRLGSSQLNRNQIESIKHSSFVSFSLFVGGLFSFNLLHGYMLPHTAPDVSVHVILVMSFQSLTSMISIPLSFALEKDARLTKRLSVWFIIGYSSTPVVIYHLILFDFM